MTAPEDIQPAPDAPGRRFAATHWTCVLQARGDSPESQAALAELCRIYWQPVFCFIRGEGRDEETARDLTQEFFARLLARHGLANVEKGRGRFRSFLLGAVKHFLADERDRARAAKRGGGQSMVSLDAPINATTTATSQIRDPAQPEPDAAFDRQWALTVVDHAISLLAAEFSAAGKTEQFNVLKPWLVGDIESISQSDAAKQLEMSEGAVKAAIHRLRKRFRELVKSEIAQTLAEPGEVRDELRYLVDLLCQSGMA